MKRNRVRIVAVSGLEKQRLIDNVFRQSNWELVPAGSLEEALHAMRRDQTPVVLCDTELPDGSWRDLAAAVAVWTHPPRLLVMAEAPGDQLWAEVLQAGYDLLLKPLNPQEVFPVLGFAWRSWQQGRTENADEPAMRCMHA